MKIPRSIADYAAYLLVRILVCLIQAASLESCQAWSRQLAWLAWHVVRLRRDVVEENLVTAFPQASRRERQRIALGMWSHLFLLVSEIAHAPRKVHRTNWRTRLHVPQLAEMLRLLIDDRPVIIISGHLGNFEMGGYLLGLHGFPTHTIARQLDNPYLDRWVNEFRGRTGQFMISKQGSSRQIAQLLDAGGTLVLLGDQYAGDGACWVDFFGKPASTHKAVALFTLAGQAPTITGAVLRTSEPLRFEMKVSDQVDPAEAGFKFGSVPLLTQWYTTSLEKLIGLAPDQYWWVHRRWKGAPDRRRNRPPRQQAAA